MIDKRLTAVRLAELGVAPEALRGVCSRWKVCEMVLFGSASRGERHKNSDIDLLVDFLPDAEWSLLDIVRLTEELEALFGRPVDLVERRALRNPHRRREAERGGIELHAG
jgi:predicted nucleotidyltransferase